MKPFAFILIFIYLVFGCECVEDINTPKIIEPDEAANVAFINAISEYESIDIFSDDVIVNENLNNNEAKSVFSMVASGNTFIKVVDAKSKIGIMNFSAEFEKGKFYTIVFYSINSRIIPLIINEDFANEPQNNIRFVNATEINDRKMEFNFALSDLAVELSVGEYSEKYEIEADEKLVKVYEKFNNSLVCELNFAASAYQIFIIQGKKLNECKLRAIVLK